MKTIPASWQTGSSRDEWYNNRGTPLLFIRIQQLIGGYIRLSNKQTLFTEEGGVKRLYDDKYYNSLSTIDTALNFMQGWAGAIGQMGQAEVVINNGEIDGTKFTDLYDLDDLINAKVDIYYVPEESGDISISNSLKQYKGIITNYKMTDAMLVLRINDYSNIDHKKIPQRVDEFNEVQSLSWTIPNQSKGKVMPICFGAGFFKAFLVNTVEGGTRYYYVGYNYKDHRTSLNISLYYFDEEKKSYIYVPQSDWSEYSYLAGDLYLIKFDVTIMSFYSEMFHFISPSSISVLDGKITGASAINDGTKSTGPSGGYTQYNWCPSAGVYYLCGYAKFTRSLFDLSANFDLYLSFENQYYDDNGLVVWDVKYVGYGTTLTIATGDWTSPAGGAPEYKYLCAIPVEWIDEGYNPNQDPYQLQLNMSPEDVAVYESVQLQCKRNAWADAMENLFFWTEVGLKQVMIKLPRDMYVKDDFGNNIIDDAINELFTTHLNIDSDNVVFENFESDYKIDGQVYEEIESYNLFCKLANEFGIIFYEDEDGKERFIDITPTDPVYEITDNDVIMGDNGRLALSIERTAKEVFSSFYVDYQKNIATKNYEASKYVTKDNHNLTYIDAVNMKLLCYNAYQNYNTEKRMSVKLDFVRDDETAERILGKLVQFYSKKRKVIRFKSSLRIMDLEKGDQVTINTSIFGSTQNYYIVGITMDYVAKTIEWILLESPWVGAGVSKVINETMAINEATHFHTGIMVNETEAINENVVHYLHREIKWREDGE